MKFYLDRCGMTLWNTLGDLEEVKKGLTTPDEKEQFKALCENAAEFLKALKMEEL